MTLMMVAPTALQMEGGVIWCCCPCDSATNPMPEVFDAAVAAILNAAASPLPSKGAVRDALLTSEGGNAGGQGNLASGSSLVRVLRPESSKELNYLRWDGDGHFDMRAYPAQQPPTLAQAVEFMRIVDVAVADAQLARAASAADGALVIILTADSSRAAGAILAGARLVLNEGASAQEAWSALLAAGCSTPSQEPALAWDRFPPTFSKTGVRTSSSVRVFDCLHGLEVARDKGWLPDYRIFDVEGWRLMRHKFDATWVLPEVLAMGDPLITACNPAFGSLRTPSSDSTRSSVSFLDGGDETQNYLEERHRLRSYSDASVEVVALKNEGFEGFLARVGVKSCSRLCFEEERAVGLPPEVDLDNDFFENAGVQVTIHAFTDGGTPTKRTIQAFLTYCNEAMAQKGIAGVEEPKIAVHCKAGLGRTGLMIGLYAAEAYGVPGAAFHGWVRMCRPGSVQTVEQERFLRNLKAKSGDGIGEAKGQACCTTM